MIEPFTIMELSIAVVGIIGSIAGCLRASACQMISCSITGFKCIRKVRDPDLKTELETELTSTTSMPITSPAPHPAPAPSPTRPRR